MSVPAPDSYVALSGCEFPAEERDLGEGISIRPVYAHVFSATMAAFQRAQPGQAHPAPWKAVRGGYGFDVEAELHVPGSYRVPGLDRGGSVWWLVAGLRIAGHPTLTAPALADTSFSTMAKAHDPWLHAVEAPRRQLIRGRLRSRPDGFGWFAKHWHAARAVASANDRFLLLVRAADEALFAPTTGLATVLMWGALEGLFLRERQELAFRIAGAVASYLEPPGPSRLAQYRKARKLYNARSRAAHGASAHDIDAFTQTWALANAVISRIAETGRAPTPDDVVSLMFAGTVTPASEEPPQA